MPGITGALAAGMTVLGFHGGSHCRARSCRQAARRRGGVTFDDMRQLPGLIAANSEQESGNFHSLFAMATRPRAGFSACFSLYLRAISEPCAALASPRPASRFHEAAAQAAYQILWLPDERLRCATHGGHAGGRRLCRDRQRRRRRSGHPQHLPYPRKGLRKGLFGARPAARRQGRGRAQRPRTCSIAVAGCVAQAEGEEIIRRAPVVDVVVGPQSYHHLPQLLARAKRHGRALETEFPVEDKFGFLPPPKPRGDPRARHFLLCHGAGRLRQILHLLRGALYARRRGVAAGGKDRR